MNEDELIDYCKGKNIILNALIELTSYCNLQCQHCYICKTNSFLSVSYVTSLIKTLLSEGTIYVSLTGGEVFTHPNFGEIYRLFKTNGFIITVKTNALLLNEEHIALFKELPPAQLNITIYGLNNDEYFKYSGDKNGFYKLVKALELLTNNGIRFSLCTIADKFHYSRIINSDYSKFFKKYNKPLEFNYDIYNTNDGKTKPINLRLSNEQILNIERELHQNSRSNINLNPNRNMNKLACRAGICNVAIDSEGNINGCLLDTEKIKLDIDNWASIKKWLYNRNFEIEQMFQESKCFGCTDAFFCQKCPLWHIRTFGDKSDNRCDLAKMKKQSKTASENKTRAEKI